MPEFVGQIWNNEYFQLAVIVIVLIMLVMTITSLVQSSKAQKDAGVALAVVAKKEGMLDLSSSVLGGKSQVAYPGGFRSGEGFLGRMEAPVLYGAETPMDISDYRNAAYQTGVGDSVEEQIAIENHLAKVASNGTLMNRAKRNESFKNGGNIPTDRGTDMALFAAANGL